MTRVQDQTYEGWWNRATWNVALWISNDEPLYRAACDFMKRYTGKHPYWNFIMDMGLRDQRTPDGFKWNGTALRYQELNDMMREFSPEGLRA